MQQTQFETTLASRSDRLAGQFLDGLVSAAPFIAGAVVSLISKTLGSAIMVGGIPLWIIYYLFADGLRDGQSLGKRRMGMRVVDAKSGAPCTFGQSFVRNVFQILGPLDSIFIFGERHQRLGDKAAGTVVVYD